MTAAIPVFKPVSQMQLAPGSTVTIPDVSWEEFECILQELGEKRTTRIAYSQGALEIMASLPERAKFVGLVSALEPLAEQKKFEYPDLKNIVKDALNKVQDSVDLPDDIKRSLEGSIRNLTRESVSHAIKRLIITHLTEDKMALEILEEAYTIRSKILHEGVFYPDLGDKSYKIEDVLRRLYSAIVGYELRDPAITYTNND